MLVAFGAPALAQQTTGTIAGRLVDAQGAAVPGVTVTGRNTQTGFVRTGVTDGEGVYRLTALPVGTYDSSPSSRASPRSRTRASCSTSGRRSTST